MRKVLCDQCSYAYMYEYILIAMKNRSNNSEFLVTSIELNSEVNAHDGKGIEVSFIKVEG